MDDFKSSDDVLAAINQTTSDLEEGGGEPEASPVSQGYSEDGYDDEERRLADYL